MRAWFARPIPNTDWRSKPTSRWRLFYARARIGEHVGNRAGQAHRIIQLAIGQQSAIGGDHAAAKLKHQTAVEIEPQRRALRFTRRVRHGRPVSSYDKILNIISKPGNVRSKSPLNPGNAGSNVLGLTPPKTITSRAEALQYRPGRHPTQGGSGALTARGDLGFLRGSQSFAWSSSEGPGAAC